MKHAWLILLALAVPARAGPLDMNTQTCQDWLDAGQDEQEQMIAWLRGYGAGRAAGALFDMGRIRSDALTFKHYCQKNLTVGLVSASSSLPK